MNRIALVAAAVLLGGLVGWVARGPVRSPRASLPPEAAASVTARDVRAIVAEQVGALAAQLLARRPEAPPPACTPVAAAAVASTESNADPVVRQQNMAMVESAIADGVWTVEDRAMLHHVVAQSAPADRVALMSKVAVAINAQKLRIERGDDPY